MGRLQFALVARVIVRVAREREAIVRLAFSGEVFGDHALVDVVVLGEVKIEDRVVQDN